MRLVLATRYHPALVALGLPLADPIIAIVITGVILRITWQSWQTVTGRAHSH